MIIQPNITDKHHISEVLILEGMTVREYALRRAMVGYLGMGGDRSDMTNFSKAPINMTDGQIEEHPFNPTRIHSHPIGSSDCYLQQGHNSGIDYEDYLFKGLEYMDLDK
jgi:hypothetical protein